MSIIPVKGTLTGNISHLKAKKTQNSDTEFSEVLKVENKNVSKKGKASSKETKKAEVAVSKEKPVTQDLKDTKGEEKVETTNKSLGSKKENVVTEVLEKTLEKVEEPNITSPLKDEEKEKLEALFELLNQFITDLSLKIGAEKSEIREFIEMEEIQGSDLLDINTWKRFVVEKNHLVEASEILTNDKAFLELEMISNALKTMMNSGEMKQLTAGMTEGSKEWNTFLEQVKAMFLEVKEVKSEEERSLEGDRNFSSSSQVPKEEEVAFSAVVEGEKSTFHREDSFFTKEGNTSPKGIENPAINGNRMFDHLLTSIKDLEGSSKLPEGMTARELMTQVTNQIKNLHAPDRMTLELLLQPATLGKVLIHVSSKNGIMQAELRVENEAAKVALENNIADLKTGFENQGFKVQEVEVMLSESGIGSNDSEKNGDQENKKNKNRGNRKIELETENRIREQEDLAVPISPEGQGGSVDYSA